ncbi:MAG: type I site-specific restriction endonuclease [Psychromonas sp.]|jgi:type I site-specific restriction endonuclease
MICDVVYEQSTLTRREWANKFKKHNYLPQYSTAVQIVLNNLLTKYVDVGI